MINAYEHPRNDHASSNERVGFRTQLRCDNTEFSVKLVSASSNASYSQIDMLLLGVESNFTPVRHWPSQLLQSSTIRLVRIHRLLSPRVHRITTRLHALNLNLRHPLPASQPQIRLLRLRVLRIVIANGAFNRVLRQHTAMQLDGRQAQFLRDLRVADLAGLLERHAANEFGEVRTGRDGGAAAEGLEFHVLDGVGAGVDFDLQFHDVAAGGGADETWERDQYKVRE